jgi:hypothetical protein
VGNAPLNRKKWVDFVYKAPNDTKLIGKLYLFIWKLLVKKVFKLVVFWASSMMKCETTIILCGKCTSKPKKLVDFVYKAPNDTKHIGRLYLFIWKLLVKKVFKLVVFWASSMMKCETTVGRQ